MSTLPINSSLSSRRQTSIDTQCNYHYPCAQSLTSHNILMNPYVFNPYALAAANLAHYNAANNGNTVNGTATSNTRSNGNANTPTNTTTTTPATNAAYHNPYAAAAIAANPALAQAAALNAYTRNIAAVQQQINGMVGLNAASLNQNGADITSLTNGINNMDENGGENEDEDIENETKNKKNKLKVEHDGFYNMKPLLAENILSSDYFKSLYRFKTYHEVIDETTRFCRNVEPLMVGLSRKPSTAFCILYKFFRCVLSTFFSLCFFFLCLFNANLRSN